jgi:hypothetical protein
MQERPSRFSSLSKKDFMSQMDSIKEEEENQSNHDQFEEELNKSHRSNSNF